MILRITYSLVFLLLPLLGLAQEKPTLALWATRKEITEKGTMNVYREEKGAHLFQIFEEKKEVLYSGPSYLEVKLKLGSIERSGNMTTYILDDNYFEKIVFRRMDQEHGEVQLYFRHGRTFYHYTNIKVTY